MYPHSSYSSLQAAAGGPQSGPINEQMDSGTGSWRGMLKRGEEVAVGDRASSQGLLPTSPQKGHAVNLLDVVSMLLYFKLYLQCILIRVSASP